MNESSIKKHFLVRYTLLMIFAGWIVGLGIQTFIPEHYFVWYPFVPLFFYVFGWFYIYMFDACIKYAPRKIQLVYWGMKCIKLLFTLLLLLFYVVKVNVHKVDFAITLFGFYLLSLTFESMFFYRYEKQKKDRELIKE